MNYIVRQYERKSPQRVVWESNTFDGREEADLEKAANEQEDREMTGLEPKDMPWFYRVHKT